MISPSVALEGGKKLLGHLIGSMNIGGSPVEPEHRPQSDDMRGTKRRPARSARTVSLIAGTGVGRFPLSLGSKGTSSQPRPSLDLMGRRGSTISDSTTRSDSTSQSRSDSPREEEEIGGEGLDGLGFGHALEGMVDQGGWTKRWGDVMSNPQ
jgi:hypothetical protein